MRTLRQSHSETVITSSATGWRSPNDANMVGANAETWSFGSLSDLWQFGPVGLDSLREFAAGVFDSVSLPLYETTSTLFSRSSSSVDVPEKTKNPEERAMTIHPDILEVRRFGTEPDPATTEGMSRALTLKSSMDDAYLRLMNWSHNARFRSKPYKDCPSRQSTSLRFLLLKSITQAGHLYKPDAE